jgi:hypothetical protein
MADDNLPTTEETLRQLIKETDKAVAKAQAAIGKVTGIATSETNPVKQDSGASTTVPPIADTEIGGG